MTCRRPLPIARSPLKRSTKSIQKRSRSKAERERIYGPPGYVEWLHEQPCVGCWRTGWSECAHIKTGGTGRKDDWTRTVPLCAHPSPHGSFGCHRSLHNLGRGTFERRKGIDLEIEAKRIQVMWASSVLEDTR